MDRACRTSDPEPQNEMKPFRFLSLSYPTMCALRNTLILMLVILSGGSNFLRMDNSLAGNAYRTELTPGNEGFSRQGLFDLANNEVISVFFTSTHNQN